MVAMNQTMPVHNTIDIRFIRRTPAGQAESNPKRDDLLHIARISDNMHRVTYTERSNRDPMVDVCRLNNHQLLAYLYRAFWLTSIDEDPFQSMQIFVPCYPSCLVSVALVKQNFAHFLDLVATTYLNWPTRGVYRAEDERFGSHLLTVGGPEEPADATQRNSDTESEGSPANPGGPGSVL